MSSAVITLWLILLQAATFGILSRTLMFPLCISLVAIVTALTRAGCQVSPPWRFMLSVFVGTLFIVKWMLAPYEPNFPVFALYPIAHVVGQYFLSLQAGFLLIRERDELPPPYLPLWGVMVYICMADIQADYLQSTFYQCSALAFTALCAFFFDLGRRVAPHAPQNGRRVRNGIVVMTLLASLALGWGGGAWLYRHWYDVERMLAHIHLAGTNTRSTMVGFSKWAQLGSVLRRKTENEEAIALRVFSDEEPGYLRGAVFESYHGGRWELPQNSKTLAPEPFPLPSQPQSFRENAFVLERMRVAGTDWWWFEIWPDVQTDVFFTRLGTSVLEAPVASVEVNDFGGAESSDLVAGQPYRLYVPNRRSTAPLTDSQRTRLLDLPPNLDPRIIALAAEVTRNQVTDEDKVRAVEAYFQQNYQYHLGITIPPGEGPMTYFLLKKPPAHCEYFASGAVVLLRLAGVPCRYVTGFVAAERNAYGNFWLARNKDAHAWAEAYLDGEGWMTVEATPAAGVPEVTQDWKAANLWDDLKLRVRMMQALLAQGGWRGIYGALFVFVRGLLTTIPGWIVSVLMGGWIISLLIRGLRILLRKKTAHPYSELRELLGRMDRQLRVYHLERLPHETLHQFAERIGKTYDEHYSNASVLKQAQAWYLDYAAIRYCGKLDPLAFHQLAARVSLANPQKVTPKLSSS